MHTAEGVRNEAEYFLPWEEAKEMLLAYADLLEAMEEADKDVQWVAAAMFDLRQRAAEKARSRK